RRQVPRDGDVEGCLRGRQRRVPIGRTQAPARQLRGGGRLRLASALGGCQSPWWTRENGPTLAFVVPPRPRRASNLIVAPTPPAAKKPAPSAPAATSGRFERSLRLMSVTSAMPPRRFSTAPASCSRSASMSPRTCSGVRPLGVAIALQRLRGQSCFLDRLLRQRRRRLADHHLGEEREQRGECEQDAGGDQKGQPRRHGGREAGRDRRKDEREPEDDEQKRARTKPKPDPERGDLLPELEDRELEFEPREAARVLGDLLRGGPDASVGLRLG